MKKYFRKKDYVERYFKQLHLKHIKIECLLSPLNIHFLRITWRKNYKPKIFHIINVLKNGKNNWYSWRENIIWNQTFSCQNTLKMECLLSPMNIQLVRIILRGNSKPRFLQIINVLKNGKNNWYSWREISYGISYINYSSHFSPS